ncbi:MAG: DUF2723 domain-containing protein [Candidatus Zixiibacteriota bacterium]
MNHNHKETFDKTNAILAGVVFLIAFVVYALTVQRSFSFWDCGEFIACSYILGIPHPPGFPLFILIGRIFSIIPFVEDISYRVNYISVLSSAVTAMFSYLLTVKLVRFFFKKEDRDNPLNRLIAYIGGIAGGLFVAFSQTNWANAVEAEVYGLALALSVAIVWLTVRYFERRGTPSGTRTMILAFYLALLGVGIHMTVFLVVPICAIFFVLKKEATKRDWLLVCLFIIVELALIFLLANAFADTSRGSTMFFVFTAVLGIALVVMLYKKINWAILVAVASASSIMVAFSDYLVITPIALAVLVILGLISKQRKWNLHWKTGLTLVIIAFIGISIHLMVPIRSSLNPRIDENNPSRDWHTFVSFLDRKQYGQMSMFERMFKRRGTWENQFGRHPHMGFWSYFEEQYSSGGWRFILPFFGLGLMGVYTAIKKRLEIGLPYLTLFLICSVGLILYMNFADGTQYDYQTRDAYLEVRNRDYFFTPAFVFFGIAMGMGVASVMQYLREAVGGENSKRQRLVTIASSALVLLPAVSLAHSYRINDRSKNNIPYNYAANMLDTCAPNAILFTAGDNDTFPLWAIQEVYDYRKDVTVVNLSLLNTDWYVEQMKNRYGVPISLTDEQILWYPEEIRPGIEVHRPRESFVDRPRGIRTVLNPYPLQGRVIRVQDMMVDEIVLENKWQRPIYFSSTPWDSDLKLRERVTIDGILMRLDRQPDSSRVDIPSSWNLFMNHYNYDGFENSVVYRDENATGVFMGLGMAASQVFNEMARQNMVDSAMQLAQKINTVYPEYWQMYVLRIEVLERQGDTAQVMSLLTELHDTLTAFFESNRENVFYMQDLGLTKAEIGRRTGDQAMIEEGIRLLYHAFELFPNNPFGFRKLVTVLLQQGRTQDIRTVVQEFATYKRNLEDPWVQRLLGITHPTGLTPDDY